MSESDVANPTLTPTNPVAALPPKLISFTHPTPIKLDQSNYILWKSQILPYLKGFKLLKYLEPQTKNTACSDSDDQISDLDAQDSFILSWIFSSLSESVLSQVNHCSTTAEVWITLQSLYSSQSLARIIELRKQLFDTHKENLSLSEFLKKLKSIADQLDFINCPVSDTDMIIAIFNGLGSEWDSSVFGITSRTNTMRLNDVKGILLSHEPRVILSHSINSDNPLALAHQKVEYRNNNQHKNQQTNIYHRPNHKNNKNQNPFNYNQEKPKNNTNSYYNNNNNNNNYNNVKFKVACQICSRTNHTADICFYRVPGNHQYNPRTPTYTPRAPAAFMSHQFSAPQFPNPPADWFLDSGCTNHLSPDLNSLSSASAYNGPHQIQIGNGAGSSFQGSSSQGQS